MTLAKAPSAAAASALPDYMTDPNAVLRDVDATWRYGKPPDYSNTRRVFSETKQKSHAPDSLEDLVQNLVKNWEIEASFKTSVSEWRTVDPSTYTFAINGGPPQSAEHMLKLGTYNAIIAPNEYYSPKHSDFASSHKTFKRMMPTFAWEVLEVYSGPPVVAFRWRHWGTMKEDYVGWNHNGEKVTAKAHGGLIDIQGVTVTHLNEKYQITKLETWFDPVDMLRQIAPEGIVTKEVAAAAARCPVMAHKTATNGTGSVKNLIRDLEQHTIDINPTSTEPIPEARDDAFLDVARQAGKAVVDDEARLGPETTASEAAPANGDIPRANAE
ncbi:Pathogen-related protein [Seiridium cupressi]